MKPQFRVAGLASYALATAMLVGVASPALADLYPTTPPQQAAGPNYANNNGGVQQAAGSALPAGVDYHIHPGDYLGVQVYGDQSLTQTVTVLPDGTVNYPLVGRVSLAGKTTDQASQRLTFALGAYVKHPYVTVTVVQPAQFTILVLGAVKTPGKYFLRSDARVSDAIAASGGLISTINGALPTARVSLGTSTVDQVSLQKLFHDGDTSQNVPLEDGSVVYVPSPNTFDVEVVGAVDHPGSVTINEGDRLSMAIARAGSSANAYADLNHVHVTRPIGDGKTTTYQINLYNTLENGDLSSDLVMHKGDVVFIPESHHGNRVSPASGGALFLLSHLAGVPLY